MRLVARFFEETRKGFSSCGPAPVTQHVPHRRYALAMLGRLGLRDIVALLGEIMYFSLRL